MLSRVAWRIYWMARYIERAENTARLVNTFNFLLLDLPRGTSVGWETLPVIAGGHELYADHYQRHDERNTVKFLLADSFYPSSLRNSIAYARENCRTSRDVLPEQVWEQINELHNYVNARIGEAIPRRGRFDVLTEIIQRCQQLTGLMAGTMSQGSAYDFVRIGRNLERADMTSRVVDIGAMYLHRAGESDNVDVHVWTSMLRALDVYQMYRKDVQLAVSWRAVVMYLLQNTFLPRAVAHCLDRVEEGVGNLPEPQRALLAVRKVRRQLNSINVEHLAVETLHADVDALQVGLSGINTAIRESWFG